MTQIWKEAYQSLITAPRSESMNVHFVLFIVEMPWTGPSAKSVILISYFWECAYALENKRISMCVCVCVEVLNKNTSATVHGQKLHHKQDGAQTSVKPQ